MRESWRFWLARRSSFGLGRLSHPGPALRRARRTAPRRLRLCGLFDLVSCDISRGIKKLLGRQRLSRTPHLGAQATCDAASYSNAKMRFQSSFMLTTIHPCFLAMSYISWLKVPTDVLGNPCAGP